MDPGFTVIGLTGGIASGKSLVARAFRDSGIPVIDADALAHMALEPDGPAYKPVLELFGEQILADEGREIDRQKLGRIVFDSRARREALERITHPAISALAAKAMELVRERGHSFAIYEAALLVETGIHEGMEKLIVVACTLENQMERLCRRDGIGREAAAVRIASQYPLEEKLKVADWIIPNDGTMEELAAEARRIASELESAYGEGG